MTYSHKIFLRKSILNINFFKKQKIPIKKTRIYYYKIKYKLINLYSSYHIISYHQYN